MVLGHSTYINKRKTTIIYTTSLQEFLTGTNV